MSGIKMELIGIDAVAKKLEEMGKRGARIENKALLKGAGLILDEAKDTDVFKDRSKDLREGLKLSGIKKQKGVKHVLIGIQKGDNSRIFYGKIIEWGSSKMKARPFMSPAYQRKKKEAEMVIKQEMKQGLGLK